MAIFTARRVCIGQTMSWQDVRLSVKLTLFNFHLSYVYRYIVQSHQKSIVSSQANHQLRPRSRACGSSKGHFKQTHRRRIFHQQQLICYLSYFHCHCRAMLCKRDLLSCSVSVCPCVSVCLSVCHIRRSNVAHHIYVCLSIFCVRKPIYHWYS